MHDARRAEAESASPEGVSSFLCVWSYWHQFACGLDCVVSTPGNGMVRGCLHRDEWRVVVLRPSLAGLSS